MSRVKVGVWAPPAATAVVTAAHPRMTAPDLTMMKRGSTGAWYRGEGLLTHSLKIRRHLCKIPTREPCWHGVYTVTFTLPGFSTVKREDVELPAQFTATVNGEMKVGALEETVVVSAASPVVDVQNVINRQVIGQETIRSMPTS